MHTYDEPCFCRREMSKSEPLISYRWLVDQRLMVDPNMGQISVKTFITIWSYWFWLSNHGILTYFEPRFCSRFAMIDPVFLRAQGAQGAQGPAMPGSGVALCVTTTLGPAVRGSSRTTSLGPGLIRWGFTVIQGSSDIASEPWYY